MTRPHILAVAATLTIVSLVAARPPRGLAADSIRTSDGKTISGAVTAMTPEEVSLEPVGESIVKKTPVPQIEWLSFDGEPKQLADARAFARAGNIEAVIKTLGRIKLDDIERAEIKQEIKFLRGLAQARLAVAGGGGKNARADAEKTLGELEGQQPKNYRYFEICEMLANLRIEAGDAVNAQKWADRIGESIQPENKARAALLSARILRASGQSADALERLDDLVNISGASKELTRIRRLAQVVRCQTLIDQDQADEAVDLAMTTIAATGEDQVELLARAYNALGAAHLKLGKKKEALLDYLHVPLLYSGPLESQAEALGNLAQLWVDVYKRNVEADKAKTELRERFPQSRFLTGDDQ